MDERGLLSEIEQDLRLAASTQRVIYLEGLTDVPILVALLGRRGSLFDEELARCLDALDRGDLRCAHALINGKWLVDDLARRVTRRRGERLRDEWIAHVSKIGGHPEVKSWWQRLRAA